MICGVCWNNLEPDGTCLTCRLAKRVEGLQELLEISREAHAETMNSQAKRILELELNIVELLFKIKELESNINDPEWCCYEHKKMLLARIEELESALCEHKKILVERVEELESNVKGFGISYTGSWPNDCIQRAFVDGAKWWQFQTLESTMLGSERDKAEDEAVLRYGNPNPKEK
jgi:hypothetical protein